jgi:hypothetical protein
MTSLLTSSRQVSSDTGYYIPLASLIGKIYGYNPTPGQSTFSTAVWASPGIGGTAKYASSISTIGAGVLRDMGRTIVSSSRTFRKVQLVVSAAVLDGVSGAAPGTNPLEDFLTGYIELGFGNGSNFTPVAAYGR